MYMSCEYLHASTQLYTALVLMNSWREILKRYDFKLISLQYLSSVDSLQEIVNSLVQLLTTVKPVNMFWLKHPILMGCFLFVDVTNNRNTQFCVYFACGLVTSSQHYLL